MWKFKRNELLHGLYMAFTHNYANIGTVVMYVYITVQLTHHISDVVYVEQYFSDVMDSIEIIH